MIGSRHFRPARCRGKLGGNELALEVAMVRILGLAAWAFAAFIAYIFIYYLQFKFTGHPGSVDLFTILTDWLGFHGHEKAMRIRTSTAELIASILLFIPATQAVRAALSLGIMTRANFLP